MMKPDREEVIAIFCFYKDASFSENQAAESSKYMTSVKLKAQTKDIYKSDYRDLRQELPSVTLIAPPTVFNEERRQKQECGL